MARQHWIFCRVHHLLKIPLTTIISPWLIHFTTLFPCVTKFSQDYRFKPAWLDSRQDYTRKLLEPDTTQLTFCSGVALQQRTAWQRFAKSKNLRFNGSFNAYMSVRPSITSPIDWPSVGGGFICPDTVLEELPLAMLTTSDWKCNSQDVIWASHSFCRDKRGCKVREWITLALLTRQSL